MYTHTSTTNHQHHTPLAPISKRMGKRGGRERDREKERQREGQRKRDGELKERGRFITEANGAEVVTHTMLD